jgi:hypothetical protein
MVVAHEGPYVPHGRLLEGKMMVTSRRRFKKLTENCPPQDKDERFEQNSKRER